MYNRKRYTNSMIFISDGSKHYIQSETPCIYNYSYLEIFHMNNINLIKHRYKTEGNSVKRDECGKVNLVAINLVFNQLKTMLNYLKGRNVRQC